MPDRITIQSTEEARLVTAAIGLRVQGATVLYEGARWFKDGPFPRSGTVPEGKALVVGENCAELGQLVQAAIRAGAVQVRD